MSMVDWKRGGGPLRKLVTAAARGGAPQPRGDIASPAAKAAALAGLQPSTLRALAEARVAGDAFDIAERGNDPYAIAMARRRLEKAASALEEANRGETIHAALKTAMAHPIRL